MAKGGKGGSPGTHTPDWDKDWPPKPKPQPKPKLAQGKSPFSTPYYDDLRNINKYKDNADKVFKRGKYKKGTNNVNEA
tara:strand:+ start:36 stop:269 length:234 start_codon:yes stop_codon:yes gene_type:complete